MDGRWLYRRHRHDDAKPRRRAYVAALCGAVIVASFAASPAGAQDGIFAEEPAPAIDLHRVGTRDTSPFAPITTRQRVDWIVNGMAGPASIGFMAFGAAQDTWWNQPSEQSRATQFARRFAIRELDVAISRSVEAGLGAMWDEDPRPRFVTRQGFWPKTGHALQSVVMAPRGDGHLAPAWGRMAGYVASGVAANAWLPEDQRGVRDTVFRISNALVGQLIGNMWKQFWPDLKGRLPQPPWARRASADPLPAVR